jgi:hypothetical protein
MLERYAESCTKGGQDSAASLVSEFDSTTTSGIKQAGRPEAPRRSCSWLRYNVTEEYCDPECPMFKAREDRVKAAKSTAEPNPSSLWRFTTDPAKRVPLDQLWRWPECFALIGLRSSVPIETCEKELTAALKRSGADDNQVKDALEVVHKLYGKYALGEDKIDKKVRDNIKGCGLKVGEDFLADWPIRSKRDELSSSDANGNRAKKAILPEGEFWVEGDGEDAVAGFSAVRGGEIITRSLAEWFETEPELAELLEEEYDLVKDIYQLPSRPDTEHEDKELLNDTIKVLDRFIDYPPGEGKTTGKDSPYRTQAAAHIICTPFSDMVPVRPGTIPTAETKTGKTRHVTITALISYRGCSLGDPTEAVVLRALGSYHVTLCVDETQDIKPETMTLLLTIYKLSFDGQNVYRCDLNNQRRLIPYPCKSFVTLSRKSLEGVPDDTINRGVTIHLGHKTRDLEPQEPNHPMFASMFKKLRTRTFALRLRGLARKIDISAALKRAGELAAANYEFRDEIYRLEGRDFSKAQTLLLPIVLMGEDKQQIKDVMEVMLWSKLEGDEAQSQSIPAKCWFALHEEVTNLYSKSKGWKLDDDKVPGNITGQDITTKMIADTVRSYLKNEGELLKDDDLKTRKVTNALVALNFEFEEGAHRASFLVTNKPSFQRGWRNCLQKYGFPPSAGEQKERQVNWNGGRKTLFTGEPDGKKGEQVNKNKLCLPPSPDIISPDTPYHP